MKTSQIMWGALLKPLFCIRWTSQAIPHVPLLSISDAERSQHTVCQAQNLVVKMNLVLIASFEDKQDEKELSLTIPTSEHHLFKSIDIFYEFVNCKTQTLL